LHEALKRMSVIRAMLGARAAVELTEARGSGVAAEETVERKKATTAG
jgi:hypothetical protein